MILSPIFIVYGLVKVKVYSANEVPKVVESILSLNVAAIESPGFFLTLAIINPEGVPVFFKRTFQDLSRFPTMADEEFKASSPNLKEVPEPSPAPPGLSPGIGTS